MFHNIAPLPFGPLLTERQNYVLHNPTPVIQWKTTKIKREQNKEKQNKEKTNLPESNNFYDYLIAD